MKKDKIVQNMLDKYAFRSAVGYMKYGTTLDSNNKDNYLKHLQEELMDATLYIEKLMDMDKEITRLVKLYPNDAELGAVIRRLVN
jgi:hypothetical protein